MYSEGCRRVFQPRRAHSAQLAGANKLDLPTIPDRKQYSSAEDHARHSPRQQIKLLRISGFSATCSTSPPGLSKRAPLARQVLANSQYGRVSILQPIV